MIAVDTSVALAAMSSWHRRHEPAREVVFASPHLPAHCGIELYSALTRLPDPFRIDASTAADAIAREYADRWLVPSVGVLTSLPRLLARSGIYGGSTYDALVALTAREHGATLLSLDRRAEPTYRALGVDYQMLAA